MNKQEKPIINIAIHPDDYNEGIKELLENRFTIEKVLNFKEASEQLDIYRENRYRSIEEKEECFIPKFIIFGENTSVYLKRFFSTDFEQSGYNKKKEEQAYGTYLKFKNKASFLGFGNGATFLGLCNRCNLLFDVKNHDVPHETTFLLENSQIVNYITNSNHNTILYPNMLDINMYKIRAFSTFNRSLHYYNSEKNIVKVHHKFVEPEIIEFNNTKSICFQYNVPLKSEDVLFNLTLEYI